MQRQLLAAIVEADVGERRVADHRVDAPFGQLRIAEALDADVVLGMQGAGDAPGDGVQLDADESLPGRRVRQEIADAATGLQDGGVIRNAEAVRPPDGWRR